MKPFFSEFTHLAALALAITLLAIGWIAMFKILSAKLPVPSGAAELFASV